MKSTNREPRELPECAPPRLMQAAATAFERRLLSQGSALQAPAAARARMATALGVFENAQQHDRSDQGTPSEDIILREGRSLPWKVAGWVSLGCLALTLAWKMVGSPVSDSVTSSALTSAPVSASPAASPVAPSELAREASPPLAEQGLQEIGTNQRPLAPPSVDAPPRRLRKGRSAVSKGPSQLPATAVPEGGLAAELQLLESARNALSSARPAAADRVLDEYARRFPDGQLRLEADLLRIDAAVAQGQRAQGQALARRLLSQAGAGRYREHLRHLLESPASAPQSGN
jgi:hypothetical protein